MVNLSIRNTGNFALDVDKGENIEGYTPIFLVRDDEGNVVDLSSYCSTPVGNTFSVNIPGKTIDTFPVISNNKYDLYLQKDEDRIMVSYGLLSLTKGLTK